MTENLIEMNKMINAQKELQERRALLDKAMIGAGAMIELIDRLKPSLTTSYDPEAGQNEALSLMQVATDAARVERERIIAALRQRASEWEIENGNMTVVSALSSFAQRLEEGTI